MTNSIIATDTKSNIEGKRILFIPDSIWGDLSGHRSSKYLVKAFAEAGVEVGVYAPKINFTTEQAIELKDYFVYFEQKVYSYLQNFIPSIVQKEFLSIIKSFKPDMVFYMGTLKNKVTMDLCIKHNIAYSYLPLTTEYYCVKDFAGLEDGPCFKCMESPIFSPFNYNCLGPKKSHFFQYIKEIFFSLKAKPRVLKANKIIGYSFNQLNYIKKFGANNSKTMIMPIFFDPDTLKGISARKGDYFVMAGQNITAKGWHVLPGIIKQSNNIKYKLIMRDKLQAKDFIDRNNLNKYVDSGLIEIVLYLKTHKELLEVVSKSRGVLVPSYYATTGEFYLLEALGLGKPVVVFNSGIHNEIIINNKNGMIANVGDIDTFHQNIQKINKDDELYENLSLGSKALFNDLVSLEKFKQSMGEYFN